MSKIQILVGTIASGKSTYCKFAARQGAIIVNDDAIVTAVHGGDYTLYDYRLKCLYKGIENHIVEMAVALDRPVIIDRGTNCARSSRMRWTALANSLDRLCDAVIFPFDGDEAHAARRHDHDSRDHTYDYWLKVVKAHRKCYDEPTLDEGLCQIHTITFRQVQDGRVIL